MTTTRAPYVTGSPVAGGTSTLSKSPQLFPENAPTHLWQALGSQVWTTDGRVLTDWISGLMAVTLGHNHPEVTAAVTTHLGYGGPTWSLPHRLEEEVAATILRLTEFNGGQVRFFVTGSEANSAAVRVARAVTGRDVLVVNGYHGWHDALLTTPPAWGRQRGVMHGIRSVPFNALASVERCLAESDDIAAVVIEPETLTAPTREYLNGLRALCNQHGTKLIFDEAITGLRYPEGCAWQHYQVTPDMLILSKSLGNGYPLAALVLRCDMEDAFAVDWHPTYTDGSVKGPIYASGTFASCSIGMAAAAAALAVWEREKVAERIWQIGSYLRYELQALGGPVTVKGPPYRLLFDYQGDDPLETKTRFLARLIDQGHLCGTGANLTFAHSWEDADKLIDAFKYALDHLDEPAGRVVTAPYRQS